jgi:hypothetical protein
MSWRKADREHMARAARPDLAPTAFCSRPRLRPTKHEPADPARTSHTNSNSCSHTAAAATPGTCPSLEHYVDRRPAHMDVDAPAHPAVRRAHPARKVYRSEHGFDRIEYSASRSALGSPRPTSSRRRRRGVQARSFWCVILLMLTGYLLTHCTSPRISPCHAFCSRRSYQPSPPQILLHSVCQYTPTLSAAN